MQTKSLQTKRALRTALLVLLVSLAGTGKGYAYYSFSAVCETGQTLYFSYTNTNTHSVALVAPNYNYASGHYTWEGYTQPTGNIILPETVEYEGVSYTVISIYEDAFYGCANLKGNLNIPNTVTEIGEYAFRGCRGFTGYLTLSESLRLIGKDAFRDCSGFKGDLTIPNSVITIGEQAFSGCSGFTGSLTIGNSVTTIGNSAFSNCSGFTGSLTIPNSVTTIGVSAFFKCSGFTGSLTIGNSVTTIGWNAFSGCSGFTGTLSIGESLRSLDGLPRHQFSHIMVASGNTQFDSRNNCDAIIETSSNKLLVGCNNTTIPNTVTSIGNSAFSGCSGLTSIEIPNSVTSIGERAFQGCGNLITIIIGKNVETIEKEAFASNSRLNMVYYNVEKDLVAPAPQSFNNNEYTAFYNCPNLTTIHIGPEVQEIGSNIFKGCNTVHFVVALGPTPAVLDAGAFSDIVDNSVLMVSCGKRVTYYSVWNMFPFNNIIEDCDTYGINVGAVGSGGTITPSVTEAQMGQEVQITITPNPGMALVSIKVVNANDPTQVIPISPMGKAASTYSFTMPPFEVVVMATFTTANTSVEENTSVSVPASVYPNPTTGYVKVEAENIKQISISNMLGQVVFDSKVGDDAFEYDFSGQKAGIYLVRIETASGVAVKKVSVTR